MIVLLKYVGILFGIVDVCTREIKVLEAAGRVPALPDNGAWWKVDLIVFKKV